MATTRIGVYRSYRGPVPVDDTGRPLPKSNWVNTRPYSWVVRWFGSEGRRYSKSFQVRKEAERFKESRQPDVRRGNGDLPQRCTLRDFYREHLQLSKGSMARKSLLGQANTLRELAARVGWDCDLAKIIPRDIEAFRAYRSECKNVKSAATVNKDVKSLRRLFNLAMLRGYLSQGRNPCDGVALLKVGQKRPRYMSPAQFELLYAEARRLIDKVMQVVLYVTGIRRGEMSHLLWDDIEFERSILHIARHSADGYVQKWSPKDHERREIPLPAKAVELLRTWKHHAPRECPYVFMDSARWEHYRGCVERHQWPENRELLNNMLRKFNTMLKRAKLGKYTLHDLRRSCITNWARKGLPIHVAQKLAGHADMKTTQKYYLSVQDEDVQAARQMQQQIVGALRPVEVTDHLLTNLPRKRYFPNQKVFTPGTQLPAETEVA